LFLAVLWLGLCRQLSGEWSVNEQYNFGWFVPLFALYLFWLRWQDRPAPEIANRKSPTANPAALVATIGTLLVLLPVRLFEIANPEWRLLAWIHAAAVVTVTLLVIWWAGGTKWLSHFAFPIAFIFIAVPWPTSVETPVIQGLMRLVAGVAAETAMLLGTPAQVEGNLVRVSTGLVGVNEACSGIRSLQTSLMIGLLFGELKRLPVSRRVALVASAATFALLANFVRAIFLVRIAAIENLPAVTRWHDIAGYSIIALVFLTTMGMAHLLGRSNAGDQRSEIGIQTRQSPIGNRQLRIPRYYLTIALCWLLFVEIGTVSWYRLHERNLISGIQWEVQWPNEAANFRKLKMDEEIRAVLRFDDGDAAAWTHSSVPDMAHRTVNTGAPIHEPSTISCLLYLFRWNPGKNSALLANLHRPDVCLPASGWSQVADDGVGTYRVNGSFELPFRHFEFQRTFEGSTRQRAHAFYCLSEDRTSNTSAPLGGADSAGMFGNRSKWTRGERVRAVFEGRRHLGQQVIEAIFIGCEPFSGAEAEAYLRNLVRDVVLVRGTD
jgi:exosortase